MNIEELKIRECLKSVYELYDEIYDFIFTTFNYEPDFFEEHIVSYLMGFDRKISTIGELQAADQWVQKNHICVYYDKNALSIRQSCLTVPVYPQNIKTGVFHPKVIVIYGKLKKKKKKSIHLFASSCNLTVSGYGRNKEAFACVEVNSKNLAYKLSGFLRSLNNENHPELQEFLGSLIQNTKSNDNIDFVWTNSDKGEHLIDYLNNSPEGDLTVVSPYFDSNGPQRVLNDLKTRKNTIIIPAVDNNFYNIRLEDYIKLKKQNIEFKELNSAPRENFPRFVHAKIIKLGEKVFVGSYNFTTAALYGKNAEASLVFKSKDILFDDPKDISEDKFWQKEESPYNHDEVSSNNILVSVNVYWKERIIRIITEGLKENENYSLRIEGSTEDLISNLIEQNEIEIITDLANQLLKHKAFFVYGSNNIVCFKGLINEFDVVECRPELGCENLSESIREWYAYSNEKDEKDKRNLRLIYPEDTETEKILKIPQERTEDIFDNYYIVSKSFENMLNQIQVSIAEKNDNNLYSYLIKSPGSIGNLISFLQKDIKENKEKDIVYEWLVAKYIRTAINLFFKYEINLSEVEKTTFQNKLNAFANDISETEISIKKELIDNKVNEKYLNWVAQEFANRD